jgi:uncharacterized membrane protein YdjX (TVP38/TMEM64 family)
MFKHHKTLLVLLLIAGGLIVLKMTDRGESVTLANVQKSAAALKSRAETHYMSSVFIFIAVYIVLTLWLPAAAVLTLLAGFIFGTVPAAIYVVTAATLGALLGFWLSRHIVGNWVQHKWHRQLAGLNRQIEKRGYIYLVFVRMIPLMPYALINFLAGLTKVPPRTIAWTTALGSLPGILIFTYAGRQFLTIKSVNDVLTPRVIIAFSLLFGFAALVIVLKIVTMKKQKSGSEAAAPEIT